MSEKLTVPYRHFLGNPIAKPPCRMLNAMMYGFFVKGKIEKIQAFFDATLNSVPNETNTYKAISSHCLLTFTDIENIASKVPPFSNYGYMQETDIIIWVPVAEVCKNTSRMTHLYWYPAFITVNNINALINGRETWGYNKYLCRYEMPADRRHADHFSLSLETFQPYDPNKKMAWYELLSIDRVADDDTWFEEAVEISKEVAELLHESASEIDISSEFIKQLLTGFTNPMLDQIFFKQFPDGFATNSVYSAVVHSPSEVKKLHKLGFLKDEYKVTFNQVDAFPLEDMFGIPVGEQFAKLPYYLCMDFDQDGAHEIVKADLG
ncbi:acetoacetate decarboxylase [Pseudoalteromonas rubra]|uniref:Acetoacetate decarboxylase n=1 Tax=Pseudoalteromonas rubra TaxID=43658 RepID=A0A5S3WWD4_9GAMM|nr:acetoacetate decarboxylase [Pseudoalteromonas rubra]TMP34287.1 acetoacetate decarboxylase [Pseudoalteromonas rubra]